MGAHAARHHRRTLDIPRSGTHCLLAMLIDEGYVRQDEEHDEYMLALKLVSLHLSFDGRRARRVTVGARPARGTVQGTVRASASSRTITSRSSTRRRARSPACATTRTWAASRRCTASGQAWLSSLTDEEALELLSKQGGLGKPGAGGPGAPKTIQQFLADLQAARERGYGIASETYEAGMTSMAAPIHHPVTGVVVGVVSLAGPTSRLPEARLRELALLEAASDMGAATLSSPYFKRSIPAQGSAGAASAPAEKPAKKGKAKNLNAA